MTNYIALVPTLLGQAEQRLVALMPRIVMAFVILALCVAAGIIVGVVLNQVAKRVGIEKKGIVHLIGRIGRITIIIIGILSALGTVGIDILPMITGLGLAGFALGFAFKDALSNTLAGILVILYRPFRLGDWIALGGYQGRVIEINLRYTTLEEEDKKYLIPNTTLLTTTIIKYPNKENT